MLVFSLPGIIQKVQVDGTAWTLKFLFSDKKKFYLDGFDGWAYYWLNFHKEPQTFFLHTTRRGLVHWRCGWLFFIMEQLIFLFWSIANILKINRKCLKSNYFHLEIFRRRQVDVPAINSFIHVSNLECCGLGKAM